LAFKAELFSFFPLFPDLGFWGGQEGFGTLNLILARGGFPKRELARGLGPGEV